MRTKKPLQMPKIKSSVSITRRIEKKSSSRSTTKTSAKMEEVSVIKMLTCTIRCSRRESRKWRTNKSRTPSPTKKNNRHLIVMQLVRRMNVVN